MTNPPLPGAGDIVRVDQEELESVIPTPGGSVLVVRGRLAGRRGLLVRIDTSAFQAEVELEGEGREVRFFEYEDICKITSGTT